MMWKARLAFALVLRCCCTEHWHRMFVVLSRCKVSTTPLNVSVTGWLRANKVTKNTGQCPRLSCTKSSKTARTKQVDIGMRRLVSGMKVVLRLVSLMPFRVCLKLIEVATDRQIPPLFGEG
jgi:hypothetical protein